MQIDSHYFTILPAYDSIHFLILSHPFPIKSNDDDDDETEKPKKGRMLFKFTVVSTEKTYHIAFISHSGGLFFEFRRKI